MGEIGQLVKNAGHASKDGSVPVLKDKLGLKGRVIVLKEEAGESKTVIEKFEEYANESCYAFALVTPDDLVRKGKQSYKQGWPNVLFEIGWFFGRYGPRRLCILKKGQDTPLPSDLNGVLTLEFAKSVEEQFLRLQQELTTAGVIDWKSAGRGRGTL
jgi:predicted nucleotide-binding protein